MKVIWEGGPMAARDIYARLSSTRDWAYSTVKTLVRRMVAKGWLGYQRVGNSFLYRPAVARKKAQRSAIREFSNRVLDGVLSPFVAYFAEEKQLTAEDLAKLQELIRRYQRKPGE
jgi:BlaI family penicillinase repressor